jgi:hypothetical protein
MVALEAAAMVEQLMTLLVLLEPPTLEVAVAVAVIIWLAKMVALAVPVS